VYEQISTGPNYDRAVKLMSTYRSIAARMANARRSTQGKLDKRLESIGERISECLGELTDQERIALTCWRNGVLPEVYEVDHDALVEKPYVSIRRIDRWVEEHDIAEQKAMAKRAHEAISEKDQLKLRSFLTMSDEDGL
jgi:hypothetical protein